MQEFWGPLIHLPYSISSDGHLLFADRPSRLGRKRVAIAIRSRLVASGAVIRGTDCLSSEAVGVDIRWGGRRIRLLTFHIVIHFMLNAHDNLLYFIAIC